MNLKTYILKSVATTVICSVILFGGYIVFEPSSVDAQTSASDTVIVTLNVTAGISITSPSDTTMSTALGVSQDTAVGTTTWNVKTNNAVGYTLAVHATATPAMQSTTDVVPDYQSGAPNTWSVSSGNSAFGYSAYGTDVATTTWGTGSACSGASAHAVSTTLKYKGLTTSDVTVATRAATTTTSGIDTNVCYAVEQDTFYIPSGTYRATVIATATTL